MCHTERKLPARGERQQRDVAGLLDGCAEASLMRSANSGQAARDDLAALGYEAGEQTNVLVVYGVDLLDTELADFLAAEEFASAFAAAGTASWTSAFAAWSAVWPIAL
jgi:hypothetical protein